MLLERKKKLEEIRSFKVPLDKDKMKEHYDKYEDFQQEKADKAQKIREDIKKMEEDHVARFNFEPLLKNNPEDPYSA